MASKLVQYSPSSSVVRLVSISAVALAACAPACSGDGNNPGNDAGVDGGVESGAGAVGQTGTGGSGGKGGATGSGGALGSGGSGGASGSGGAPGSGGSGGASGSGGAPGSSGGASGSGGNVSTGGVVGTGGVPESGVPDAQAPDARAPDGQAPDAHVPAADGGLDGRAPGVPDGGVAPVFTGFAMAAMTDFTTGTEIAVVDLASGSRLQDFSYTDTDAVPVSNGGRGFILERTSGIVHTLHPNGSVEFDVDLPIADGGTGLNPHDVVPIPGTSKAYVSLYASNRLDILDLTTGAVTGSIDLSQFADAADPDGNVETDVGVYDPTTQRVYFALQRLDLVTYGCPTIPSLLIGIDPATDTVVDVNGAADGNAVSLRLVSPGSLALDGDKLFVLANGCAGEPDGSFDRVRHGIEVVTLSTGTTAKAYAPTAQNFLTGVALIDDGALVSRYDLGFSRIEWNRWNVTSSDLGAALVGTPDDAAVETNGTLVGVQSVTVDASTTRNIVRYSIASGETSLLTADPFTHGYVNISGITVVR